MGESFKVLVLQQFGWFVSTIMSYLYPQYIGVLNNLGIDIQMSIIYWLN